MLVLSRKKCEAILIDGSIRIDIVNTAKAMVRVRLMTPQNLQVPHGVARKEIRDQQDSTTRISPVGMDVVHMTLINQQVVNLSESVSLGVVDADKSRVLFFVDAPAGTSVMAVDQAGQDYTKAPANQVLLQFMRQGAERPEEHREQPAPGDTSRAGETASNGSGADRDVLPFPTNQPDRNGP
jgi:sRNA-binding carbon storage regulator CsrA